MRAVSIMSAVGQKRKSSVGLGMSALGGKADIDFGWLDVLCGWLPRCKDFSWCGDLVGCSLVSGLLMQCYDHWP